MHDARPDAWKRVAAAIKKRRSELGYNQAQVYGANGPSLPTLRNLETAAGLTYRDDTLASLERVLGWAPGSISAILNGEEPTEATGPIVEFAEDDGHGGKKITVGLPASANTATPEQIEEIAAAAKAHAWRLWREMNGE